MPLLLHAVPHLLFLLLAPVLGLAAVAAVAAK